MSVVLSDLDIWKVQKATQLQESGATLAILELIRDGDVTVEKAIEEVRRSQSNELRHYLNAGGDPSWVPDVVNRAVF